MKLVKVIVLGSVLALTSACGKDKDAAPATGTTGSVSHVEPSDVREAVAALETETAETTTEAQEQPAGTVRIKSHSGEMVDIAIEELRSALASLLLAEGRIFSSLNINSDGSVSITDPGFMFEGERRWLGVYDSTTREYMIDGIKMSMNSLQAGLLGVCKLMGFNEYLVGTYKSYSRTDTVVANLPAYAPEKDGIELTPHGRLFQTNLNPASNSSNKFIRSVTCYGIR